MNDNTRGLSCNEGTLVWQQFLLDIDDYSDQYIDLP